ncbi:esterase/lipase [Morchella conica CCBAS932]|uniref:Esterase/lipase n=1 Tax=Morchella conica CCBAS932 TaxID=1392247 RepID=A0A3N4KNW0_9PEZI|nr:esterase/lipase [Morchella conica CCBAS932]
MASACCVQGTLQNDSPNGTVTVIHGLDTYVASGDSSKGVIVIIPDVFGWLLINTRLLADVYARKTGLSVYVPDFMFGDSFPVENMQLGAWMFRHREAVSWKIINGFFEAIHKENTTRKVFVSGFCWGGRYACLLAQREKWLLSDRTYREGGLVDAVFAAHPSLLAIPKDIELIAKPVSFAMAEEDERLPMKDVEKIIEILGKQKMFKSEVVTYDGAKHGFALRGNIEIQAQRENMENSQDQAVNWFKQYLD